MNTNYKEILESFTQKIVNNTKNITQDKKRQDILSIQFEDPEVERICHEHGIYTYGDAKKVTSIDGWFSENNNIKAFNEFRYFTGLKSIVDYAFSWCTSLQSVIIPDSVTRIEKCAFIWCESLQSVNIPDSVTRIRNYAFEGCKALQSITIPNSVTSIGDFAFYYCESLQSINIPDSVTSIGEYAFYFCESLQSINISKRCPVYNKIAKEYPKIQLVEPSLKESFTSNVIDKAKSKTQDDKRKELSYIKFEDPEVERIFHEHGVYTYDDARKVTSIKWFKDNINIKTFNEFKYFTGLKSVEEWTFNWCKYLQFINIPDSVTSIGDDAFAYCTSLTSINIPDSVTSIGDCAFHCCYSLESVNIPGSVTSIGEDSFAFCKSLKSIIIPNSVTSIGNGAFRWCETLQSIVISKKCPVYAKIKKEYPDVQIVEPKVNESFTSSVIDKTKSKTQYDKRADIAQIKFEDPEVERICHEHGVYTIGDASNVISINEWFICNDKIKSFNEFKYFTELKSVKDNAFNGCNSLLSINIPDSVTSIGYGAFKYCRSLTSINIPDSVTSIGYGAFKYCTSLTSINIPNSVTSIGEQSFYRCTALQSINISLNSEITSIEKDAFYGCESLQSIIIPSGVSIIESNVFSGCKSLQSINIPHIVTSIKNNAFYGCHDLKSITIPNSVTSIGKWAFGYCKSLQSIIIPDSVTSIGELAFDGCTSLRSISIPNNVTSIEDWTFGNCVSLQSIIIPDSVTRIGENVFRECKSLKSIIISNNCPVYDKIKSENPYAKLVDPTKMNESFTKDIIKNVKSTTQEEKRNNVVEIQFEDKEVERICHEHSVYTIGDAKQVNSIENWFTDKKIVSFDEFKYFTGIKIIDDNAFWRCFNLKSITIPDSVVELGDAVFSGCESLESIDLPDKIHSIGSFCFVWSKLEHVKLPISLERIGRTAFFQCEKLQTIDIPDSLTNIDSEIFKECKNLRIIYISKDSPVYDQVKEYYPRIHLIANHNMNESFTKDVINNVKSTTQKEKRRMIEQIQFEDPEVERICHEHSVYTTGDAARVTSIKDSYFDSWFDESHIKSFKEFKYFTGLRSLERYSFYRCHNLQIIEIPNSITKIEAAFYECSSLQYINIPDSVTIIKDQAFEGCKSLESINIPDSVTTIGTLAFTRCRSLEKIYISMFHPLRQELYEQNHDIQFVDPSEMNESFTKNVIKKVKSTTQEEKRKIVSLPDRDLLIDFIVNGYKPLYATSDQILPYLWDVIKRCNENIETLQKIHFNVYKTQLEFTYLNGIGTHVPIVSVNMNYHFPASVVHNFAYAKKEVRDKRKYKNLYELTCTYADMIIELCKKYSEISDHIKSLLDSHFSGSSVTESFTSKVIKDTKEKSQLDNKDKVEDFLYGNEYNDFPEFVEDLENNLNEKGYLVKNNKLDANNYRRSTYMTERQKGDYFPVLKWSVRYHYRRHNVNICKIYYPLSLIDDFYRQRSIIFLRISLLSNPNDFNSLCNSTIDLFTMKEDRMISMIYSNEIYNKEFLDIIGFDKKTENYNGVKLNGILLYHIEKFLIKIINKLDTVYQDNTTYRSYILSLIDSEKGYPTAKDIYLKCTNVINKLLENKSEN